MTRQPVAPRVFCGCGGFGFVARVEGAMCAASTASSSRGGSSLVFVVVARASVDAMALQRTLLSGVCRLVVSRHDRPMRVALLGT